MALTFLKSTAGVDPGATSPVVVPPGESTAQIRAYAVEYTDQVEADI